jgi:transcriptional regulator with XRE-family HTH domain
MQLGDALKKIREARHLSQKELALVLKMDQAQYSRIESGKTDPAFTVVVRIAQALDVNLSELSEAEMSDIHSADRSLLEKIRLMESLDEGEKQALFAIVDGLVTKKRLRESLRNTLELVG